MRKKIILQIFVTFFVLIAFGNNSSAQVNKKAEKHLVEGYSLFQNHKYSESIENVNKAFKLESDSPSPNASFLATCYHLLAKSYEAVRKFDLAIENYEKFAENELKALEFETVSNIYRKLGLLYYLSGSYKESEKFFQKALKYFEEAGNEPRIAIVKSDIGENYRKMGNYKEAMIYFKQSKELFADLHDEANFANALNNIGAVHYSLGEYADSIKFFNEALDITKKNGEDIHPMLINISSVYYDWGKYDEAIVLLKKSLDYYYKKIEETSDTAIRVKIIEKISTILSNIAVILERQGNYNFAIDQFGKCMEYDKQLGKKESLERHLNHIGSIYRKMKQYDKALSRFEEALDACRELNLESQKSITLNNIGNLYASIKKYGKAIASYTEALSISKKLGQKPLTGTLLHNIGFSYFSLDKLDNAIEFLEKSIEIKNSLRKTATGGDRRDYLESQIFTYQIVTSAYKKKSDLEGVLKCIEQSRALLLAEQIAGQKKEPPVVSLKKIQKNLENNEAILIFTNINLDNHISMLITKSGSLVFESTKTQYLEDTKNLYRKQLLASVEKKRNFKIISNESEQSQHIVKDEASIQDFETSINYYRTSLVKTSQDFLKSRSNLNGDVTYTEHSKKIGRSLYDLLIKPFEEKLQGIETLIIVPGGILNFLPFETLSDVGGKYLVEKFNIKYIQSLNILDSINNRRYNRTRKSLIAFGGAVYDKVKYDAQINLNKKKLLLLKKKISDAQNKKRSLRKFYHELGITKMPNLPGTLSEVQTISKIVKKSEIVTGYDVTENKIKEMSEKGVLKDYKVLHFAVHGLTVPSFPELSAIVLSLLNEDKNGEDGFLSMSEIVELNIESDFVNLSACETGLGKIYEGDGVVGLTQAFIVAGSNSVSVSLWPVADESTALFMSRLYQINSENNSSYDRCITEVKREFISGKHGSVLKAPFFWAPFVYYGK